MLFEPHDHDGAQHTALLQTGDPYAIHATWTVELQIHKHANSTGNCSQTCSQGCVGFSLLTSSDVVHGMHCNRGQTQFPKGQRCAWLVHFWLQGLLPCSVVRQVRHDKPCCIVQSARSAVGTGMWFDLSSACDRGFRQRRRDLCTGLCTRQKNPSGDSARQSAHHHELGRAGVNAY